MATSPGEGAGAMRVVVVGGGIAGAEALLALHELAGPRVSLTLVSAGTELVLPPLSVAEPFALGHAQSYPLDALLQRASAGRIEASLAAVDDEQREIELDGGRRIQYDALLLATGAKPVARVDHATTWWPRGGSQAFSDLLRDLEEGYAKRVAFVIPPGAVWPLPLYELALMTARQVGGMGIEDFEFTVITPEPLPLALFGAEAADAVREELEAAGVRLETAALARVESGHPLQVVLQPSVRRLEVDRVIALPGVEGPAIPGTARNDDGFILVGQNGQMRGSDTVWAAGDAIAYPVKFGGLAAQQADAAASEIATRAGVQTEPAPARLTLQGVLMTGGQPRALGGESTGAPAPGGPIWRPTGKVFGRYLTSFLAELDGRPEEEQAAGGIEFSETLPGPESEGASSFHALWRPEKHEIEYLRSLGREIHDYEDRHRRSAEILHEHGQLRRDR